MDQMLVKDPRLREQIISCCCLHLLPGTTGESSNFVLGSHFLLPTSTAGQEFTSVRIFTSGNMRGSCILQGKKMLDRCCVYYQWSFFISGTDGVDDGAGEHLQLVFRSTKLWKVSVRWQAAIHRHPDRLKNRLAETSWSVHKGTWEALHLRWSNLIQH